MSEWEGALPVGFLPLGGWLLSFWETMVLRMGVCGRLRSPQALVPQVVPWATCMVANAAREGDLIVGKW